MTISFGFFVFLIAMLPLISFATTGVNYNAYAFDQDEVIKIAGNQPTHHHVTTTQMGTKIQTVDIVKWIATIIQLIGYGMTGLNFTPYNVYLFFIGIFLWFAVGVMWKDKAIMVVHVGAFISLLVGYIYA